MDDKNFDTIARGLASETSRRQALAGALSGAIALVTGGSTFAARRKRKRRGDGNEDEALLVPGTQVGGVWDETIEICHFDWETGEHQVMAVSTPSLPEYLNLGDTLYIDCCVDTDCLPQRCLTPSGCIEGACMYDITEGASCVIDGVEGVCDSEGSCIAIAVPTPVTVAPVVTAPVETVPVG
jgi:hypothetical protein